MYELPCLSCYDADVQDPDDVMILSKYQALQPNPRQRYVCPICGYSWTNSKAWQFGDNVLHYAGLALMLIVAISCYFLLDLGVATTAIGVGVTAVLIGLTEQFRSWLEDVLDPVEPELLRNM